MYKARRSLLIVHGLLLAKIAKSHACLTFFTAFRA